ncbi:hypothetical protein ElyMa_000490500 [Elysia marginata]|uniref:G-protein coupled receptors family 1 profile domain-containing protein n=1 Tax=Elysia marginata TaxID=1093978 RepID=A0AAV4FTZ9_9GAST|nr:hypothetical protein ElyMa_000490500 [Elysia marginata]
MSWLRHYEKYNHHFFKNQYHKQYRNTPNNIAATTTTTTTNANSGNDSYNNILHHLSPYHQHQQPVDMAVLYTYLDRSWATIGHSGYQQIHDKSKSQRLESRCLSVMLVNLLTCLPSFVLCLSFGVICDPVKASGGRQSGGLCGDSPEKSPNPDRPPRNNHLHAAMSNLLTRIEVYTVYNRLARKRIRGDIVPLLGHAVTVFIFTIPGSMTATDYRLVSPLVSTRRSGAGSRPSTGLVHIKINFSCIPVKQMFRTFRRKESKMFIKCGDSTKTTEHIPQEGLLYEEKEEILESGAELSTKLELDKINFLEPNKKNNNSNSNNNNGPCLSDFAFF